MRTSLIWTICDNSEFLDLVRRSNSYKSILGEFGVVVSGGSVKILKDRILKLGIDISHFERKPARVLSNNDVFCINSSVDRGILKRIVIRNGLLQNRCSICGLEKEWQGRPIVMIIDHINGVNNDNRIENLRMVCQNCNSQLETFAGKNVRKERKHFYCECGAQISRPGISCKRCAGKKKTNTITKEQLEEDMKSMSVVSIGKKYGVSDNAVRKWCRRLSVEIKDGRRFYTN